MAKVMINIEEPAFEAICEHLATSSLCPPDVGIGRTEHCYKKTCKDCWKQALTKAVQKDA